MLRDWIWKSADNERLSMWNGSFAMASRSVVNGFAAMYLLDALHASNAEMGLLNSLPSLINLLAMVTGAALIQRVRSKRRFCATATTVARSFYVWMALAPLLPLQDPALWVVWLVALTAFPQSFADLSWQALIAELIAPERRSTFFSERNRVVTIVGLVVTALAGLVLQQFDKHAMWPYQIAFGATVIFAVLEVWLLLLHREPSVPGNRELPVVVKGLRGVALRAVRDSLRDRRFVFVATSLLLFNFAWQMAWPLFNIFQIKTAHAPALWLGLISVANQVAQIASFRWWGRMADKYGTGRMMGWAAVGMAAAPVLTVLSTNMYYLTFINLFIGIPVAGTLLLLFNYLLEVCPEGQRTTYIALYNVALSVVGFTAPEVGIWLLDGIGMTGGMIASSLLRALAGLGFFVTVHWTLHAPEQRGRELTV